MHHYSIIPLFALLLLPALHLSPHTPVFVSFAEGQYDAGLVGKAGGRVIDEFEEMGMLYAMVPQNALAGLERNPAVEFVEGDGQYEVAQDSTSVEYAESWGLSEIGAEPVHRSNNTGAGVRIAVLDTGVYYEHPELAPSYRGGYDFINNDDDPVDDNGHGTHVAGIIAAARNDEGTVGVAPGAEIYAIKVSDSKGKGSFSGLVKGIEWSIENGMDIVTMSITGEGGSRALKKAVETAYGDHNLILLAAIGNGGSGNVLYPAAYEQVIGVGSVTKDNVKSPFSRTGSEVELVAPGSSIKSTWLDGKYRLSSGTSMATPFVTGAIALLLGSSEAAWAESGLVDGDGIWTNDEVREVLHGTSIDLGDSGKDNSFGYGLLNLQFPETESKSAIEEPAGVPLIKVGLRLVLSFHYSS